MRSLKLTLATAIVSALFAGCDCCYTPVETYVEPADPATLSEEAIQAWDSAKAGLNAAWGSADLQYSRSEIPALDPSKSLSLCGWRGEKISAQLLLWTADGVNGA